MIEQQLLKSMARNGSAQVELNHGTQVAIIDGVTFAVGPVDRTVSLMEYQGYVVKRTRSLLGLGSKERITIQRD